jgi:hypothetical protein
VSKRPPTNKPEEPEDEAGKPRRVRRWERLAAQYGVQPTKRDEEIVRWVTQHGVVTTELVGWQFFWDRERKTYAKWGAYKRLSTLQKIGLLRSDRPYAYEPAILRVTPEGAALANIGLHAAPLVLHDLRHTIAVVQLTQTLLDELPDTTELTTERELRAERYRQMRDGERQSGQGRIPDALLRVPTKGPGAQGIQTVAVELDLTRKDVRAMEKVVRQYNRERVDKIWWYVTKGRVDNVRKVVRRLRADDRIEVRAWLG